jgi:hypothetical protein
MNYSGIGLPYVRRANVLTMAQFPIVPVFAIQTGYSTGTDNTQAASRINYTILVQTTYFTCRLNRHSI